MSNFASTTTETPEQRLARIVDQIMSGERTLDQLRRSADRIRGDTPGDYNFGDTAGYVAEGRESVEAAVRDVFAQRGLSLDYAAPLVEDEETGAFDSTTAESPEARLARIVAQVMSGERTLDEVRGSVDRIAGRDGRTDYGDTPGYVAAGPDAVRQRVLDIFDHRGVSLDYSIEPGDPGSLDPLPPPTPIGGPTDGPGTPGPEGDPRDDPNNQDAHAYITNLLRTYGLESLSEWAWDQIIAGTPTSQIIQELRERPEYLERFPGMELRREAGFGAISEAEYLAYEAEARSLMRSAGLPEGFFDAPEDIAEFIGGNVSISELDTRVNQGFVEVAQAPEEVRDIFAEWYGADGDAALAAFYLDPERSLPLLEEFTTTAIIGGTASRFGFDLTRDRAGRLTDIGVTGRQAQRGFDELSQLEGLFSETVSETEDLTAEQEGVDAVFGVDGEAREALQQRRRQRRSFLGGGGAAVSSEGAIGLGEAPS